MLASSMVGAHVTGGALNLTGVHVQGCTFERCELTLDRLQADVVGNNFNDCTLLGDGWPLSFRLAAGPAAPEVKL